MQEKSAEALSHLANTPGSISLFLNAPHQGGRGFKQAMEGEALKQQTSLRKREYLQGKREENLRPDSFRLSVKFPKKPAYTGLI